MFGTAAPHNHPRHHMASGHIALAFRTSLAPCSGPKKVLWRGCFVPHAFCTCSSSVAFGFPFLSPSARACGASVGSPRFCCPRRLACRESGGRVSVNQHVRDFDIAASNAADNRRLEVVADGLPLFHGAQLAIHTTMVAPHRGASCKVCRCRWGDHGNTKRKQRPQ